MNYSVVSRLNPPLPHVAFDFSEAVHELNITDARRGEDYAFGIVFVSGECGDVSLVFGSLKGKTTIPDSAFECINFGGTDIYGASFTKKVTAAPGSQIILWSTVRIPEDADGSYSGSVTLKAGNETVEIPVSVAVSGDVAEHGWGEPEKLTRLRWLNSDLEQKGRITAPFTKPVLEGNTVKILGRAVTLADNGLPCGISSYYNKNIKTDNTERPFSDGITFRITYADGTVTDVKNFDSVSALRFEETNDGYRSYAVSENEKLTLAVTADNEYDGYGAYNVLLTAKQDTEIADISLVCGLAHGFDTLAMGLGLKGGTSPDEYTFVWDKAKHQNSIWAGGVNGGIRLEFKGGNFIEPLVNIYYRHRPLNIPDSYGNPDENGNVRGKVTFVKKPEGSVITASTGMMTLKAGEPLNLRFDTLITPLKEFNLKSRITTRYYHTSNPDVDEAARLGATHVTWHHAGDVNPFINYPFRTTDKMIEAVKYAHSYGMGAKFYYTVREQSDKTCEMNAFLTLGTEIFPTPVGGQKSILWSDEQLVGFRARFGNDYIPAWQTEYDMAVITDGQSRLCNYYVEGLNRLVEKVDIDGIYIDDVAYTRNTIRRARRVLDADGRDSAAGIGKDAPRKIDLHTWSHYCELAGYGNSLNLYMTLLPYIDSIWIGEGFNHMGEGPDYWLAEITGLPYGCVGELLLNRAADYAAKYRGMLFGITSRQPWTGDRPMGTWNFFDKVKLADASLCGFWNDESPLSTGDDRIKGSVFTCPDCTVIALASWADEPVTVSPVMNGKPLENAEMPEIDDFQQYSEWNGSVTIEPGLGKVIVIK